METKDCLQCKKEFSITQEDFEFYEKLKVPPPTLCPGCRQRRRYAWRNERVLYRRDCDLCKKSTVTIYSPKSPYTVYCPSCWWSDNWDPMSYGAEYDFNRGFFEQFKELQLKVPRMGLLTKNSVNSDYTNHAGNNKNCYLSFGIFDSENVYYSANTIVSPSKDCIDCYWSGGEVLYNCINCTNCYNCQYGMLLKNCTDCYYSYDLRDCSNCFLSSNLRSKSYCFKNEQLSKEEYEKKVSEYKLSSPKVRKELYEEYKRMLKSEAIHRDGVIENSNDCTGSMVFNSKTSTNIFDTRDAEDCKYIVVTVDIKDSMDVYHVGYSCERTYESQGMVRDTNVFFSHLCYDNSDMQYGDTCHNSQELFGCISLKKKKYCIFNTQYSKEEYLELKERIIKQMTNRGEYGEFYPVEMSPFGYNETQGMVYMPMTKEEVLANGWKWEDDMPGTYGKETVSETPSGYDDSITKEVLKCSRSGKNYNITPYELSFYKQHKLPIPDLCPEERYQDRINLRPKRELFDRSCSNCKKQVQSSYSTSQVDIVYCYNCYKDAVL